jgi:hypothetical protein
MTSLRYFVSLLHFHTLRQALICTAPLALFSQIALLNVFWAGQGQPWYEDPVFANVIGWIAIGVVAWLFLAASITNYAISKGKGVALGVSLRSQSPAADRTAYWITAAITILAFLGVFAYLSVTPRPGNHAIQVALATAVAASAALLVSYDIALLVWLVSGFRNCPGRPRTLTEEESTRFTLQSHTTEGTHLATQGSSVEELQTNITETGRKSRAVFERQRAELRGKTIPEIGGILGRKLGARLPKTPRNPDA